MHAILETLAPDIARQALEPREILFKPRDRPKLIPKPFIRTDGSYREWVLKNCKSGLQRLVKQKHVFKHKGKVLLSGALAVPKDIDEDRSISALCPLNALIDPSKLWRPIFAAMPALRAVRTDKTKRLRIFKKDARHYFHQLGLGRKLEKYLAHPPVLGDNGHMLFPLHRAVPMGLRQQPLGHNAAPRLALPVPTFRLVHV